jgi:hypothetical protein
VTEPSPGRPSSLPPVQYKGEDLDPERGPGLGCFWTQMILLGALLVATPLSVSMGAPSVVSAILLFATLGLLLVSGQTIIFLLRLVAADRREGRRRPLASATRTVGELEDVNSPPASAELPAPAEPAGSVPPAGPAPQPPSDEGPVRQ